MNRLSPTGRKIRRPQRHFLRATLALAAGIGLLAPPVYSRPAVFNGWEVPEVLMQGDPKKVEEWRHEQALLRTKERRPDLLDE